MVLAYSRMFRAGSSRSIESTIQAVTSYYKPLQHGLVRSNIYLRIVFIIDKIHLNTQNVRRVIFDTVERNFIDIYICKNYFLRR